MMNTWAHQSPRLLLWNEHLGYALIIRIQIEGFCGGSLMSLRGSRVAQPILLMMGRIYQSHWLQSQQICKFATMPGKLSVSCYSIGCDILSLYVFTLNSGLHPQLIVIQQ